MKTKEKKICIFPGCDYPVRSKGYCNTHYGHLLHEGAPRETLPKNAKSTEFKNPEVAAELIDAASDPFARLTDAAEACGMPTRTAQALIRRLRTKYQSVNQEVKELKTNELRNMINQKIHMTLDFMDEFATGRASYKDLAIGLGILIEKRQLLDNMPTQILDVRERQNLNTLLPSLLRECERRGFTIEATPLHHDDEEGVATGVLLPSTPQEESYNKTAVNLRGKLQFAERE